MDTRYLRSLIAVVECGSIADAARAEHLTAAAISQRIQSLEREFGFALLSRGGHAARATQACLAILPRARRIVREVDGLADDVDPRGLTGVLRVGAISTALTGMLPAALRALAALAPGIRPHIVPGSSRQLYQSLQDGELDAALLVAPPFVLPKTLAMRTIRSEPLVLLSGDAPVGGIADALQRQPYIRYDPLSWGGRLAESYLRAQGMALTPLFDLDALEAIAMLVADGVGVSLVPRWPGLERLVPPECMTLVAGDAYVRQIVLLTALHGERASMTAALLQALLQAAGQPMPAALPMENASISMCSG